MTRETTIAWPEDTLGCPIRQSYSGVRGLTFARMDVMDGPARFRLNTDDNPFRFTVTFNFDPIQFYIFEQFYSDTLEGGSLWFTMRQMTGSGMQDMVVHIKGDLTYVPLGKANFAVSMELEGFYTSYSRPPDATFGDPVDAQTADAPSTDIYDAMTASDARPTDVINALVPGVIP